MITTTVLNENLLKLLFQGKRLQVSIKIKHTDNNSFCDHSETVSSQKQIVDCRKNHC